MSHETMSERVRDIGDGLILAFPITQTQVANQSGLDTTRMYFFRVARETRFRQKYTSLANIAGDGTTPSSGYDWLGDTGVNSGSDIFRIETDDWHLQHFGVGTNHPDLEVFYAVSPDANGNPAQDRTGDGEDITPGTDDRGWYSSKEISDQWDPPAFTERVAFKNNQNGEFLHWAFHNDLSSTTLSGSDLHLFFTGRGYKVQPVTNGAMQDTMLEMALRRPDDPEIDTIMHTVGGVNTYTLGSEEPDSWGEVEEMTRDFNVQAIAGGGGGGGGGERPRRVIQ